jgi:peptidoglycan/xylan/chitin deacetylase (PgdA/CDA1 family)
VANVPAIDPAIDDWNVTPPALRRQFEVLAKSARVVPLASFRDGLTDRDDCRPLVCLTFDDGYANFHTNVLPLLREFHLPAALFVVTSAVGVDGPMPFDRWSVAHAADAHREAWVPLTWKELEECAGTGLVAIGAHSHWHKNGSGLPHAALLEEAVTAREMLRQRLGEACTDAYAYPYGSRRLGQVSDAYVDAVRTAGYTLAVTTDLGLANAHSDPLALPRVEAHGLDGGGVLLAKARGHLAPYRITDRLRRSRRWTGDR